MYTYMYSKVSTQCCMYCTYRTVSTVQQDAAPCRCQKQWRPRWRDSKQGHREMEGPSAWLQDGRVSALTRSNSAVGDLFIPLALGVTSTLEALAGQPVPEGHAPRKLCGGEERERERERRCGHGVVVFSSARVDNQGHFGYEDQAASTCLEIANGNLLLVSRGCAHSV